MAYILKIDRDNNFNRKKVELDTDEILSVHNNVIKYFKIREYSHIKINDIKETLANQELTFAKDYSLYLLGQSPRSRKQLIDKMKGKGYDADIIDRVIVFLDEYTLLDDKEYASNYIQSRSKKYGSNRLKYDLRAKGVEDRLVKELLDDVDRDKEYEVALEQGRQRLRSYAGDDKQKIYRKLGGYLSRRGFGMDIVRRVLSELLYDNNYD